MSIIERFMAADPEHGVALDICRVPAGLRFTVHSHDVVSAWVDPKQAPAIALSVLKAAGQESVIVPKPYVGKVIETASGTLMIEGQTYPSTLSYWEASEGTKARGLADAASYAAKVDAALAFIRGKAAREAAETAEAEAAEKKLQERRDALAKELSICGYDYLGSAPILRTAINRILALEDAVASRD